MAHKIEGYVRSNQDRFFGPKGNSSPIVMHEEAELGRKHHQATIVLHEGKAERVFTESEVKALLRDIMNDQTSADIANGYVNVVIGWAEIFRKHGLSFLDPA